MKEETLASYVYSLRNHRIITREEMIDLIVRVDSLTEKDTEESIPKGKLESSPITKMEKKDGN